jgi:hypothetical protein
MAEALRTVERGSPVEKALIDQIDRVELAIEAVGKLAEGLTGAGAGSGRSNRGLAVLISLALLAMPVLDQLAGRLLAPTTRVEAQLDELIEAQGKGRAELLGLTRWVVDCERARREARSMPEPPASVRLMLAEDDVARSTP